MTFQAPARPLFRLADMQADFDGRGYAVRRILTREQAGELLAMASSTGPDDGFDPQGSLMDQVTYHLTELDTNSAYKRRVLKLAADWLDEPLRDLLPGYRILTASLFVKPPGKGGMAIHSDWTLQEDLECPTINIWCALQDIDEANGPIAFVDGSHRLFDDIHGPTVNPQYAGCESVLAPLAKAVTVEAGTAIFFDAGMLHCSLVNHSGTPRFALRISCIPEDRRGVLYRRHPDDPGTVEMFAMDVEDYFDHPGSDLVSGGFHTSRLGTRPSAGGPIAPDEMAAILARANAIRAGRTSISAVRSEVRDQARLDEPPIPQPTPRPTLAGRAKARAHALARLARRAGATLAGTLRPAPQDFTPYPGPVQPRALFNDPAIDGPLNDRGFATFQFVPPGEIDRLADAVAAAQSDLDRGDVHIPTRFQLSAFNNDSAYKERLYDAVWKMLKARVEAVLPGYEPLVINLFDKPPAAGYDPVPIHQNPSFVDEPAHKSVSLWIPLCDVGKDNGTVGVLPRSHNRFNRVRSGNMAHEEIFALVSRDLEQELFEPVEMRKGEMLVLDDSIIHWSYPNISDQRRSAVQLIMVPSGVPHIYYFYDDQAPGHPMMDLYEVDRHFFFGFNCKARPETLKHIGRMAYRYRPITKAEMMRGLVR